MAPHELRLSGRARRVTGWLTAVLLPGLGMTGIVFADNSQWAASATAFGALFVGLYLFGTAAYRVTAERPGRIETHTLLGLRRVEIADGFRVRRSLYGPVVVVVKIGRRRIRLNGGLGAPVEIDAWLRQAQTASVTA